MKRVFLSVFLCMLLGTNFTYVRAEEPLQLYAKAAVLMDGSSGRILFSKNGQEILPMASTTKIMTCILALEYGKFNDEVTFSETAASQPKVHLGAAVGERFLLRDLLYSLMLESHNDTAVAVAESVGGSVPAFTEMMNAKAVSLGCTDTHFVTPNGLDDSDVGGAHSTTASDLARIMKYCITDSEKRDEFLRVTRMETYTFSNLDGTRQYSCQNHNAFLQMMTGALSGKTGFTGEAGYCYVGALESEGRTFIVALLACGWPSHKSYKWSDTQKLMQYGMEHYQYREIKLPELGKISVREGVSDTGDIFANAYGTLMYENGTAPGKILLGKQEEIETRIEVEPELTAPKEKGEQVGKIELKIGDEVLVEDNIVMKNSIKKRDFNWAMNLICWKYTKTIKYIN